MTALVDAIPPEDAGAQTQLRYNWQHESCVPDCIAMVAGSTIKRIVCEFHEDHVVEYVDGTLELVSVKSRVDQAWSLGDLCTRGGIAHLFSRWTELPGSRARLITCVGLKAGPNEARQVVAACGPTDSSESPQPSIDRLACAEALARKLLAAGRRSAFLGIPNTDPPRRGAVENLPDGFLAKVLAFMN